MKMKCPAPRCGKANEPDAQQRKGSRTVWYTCAKCGARYGQKMLEGLADEQVPDVPRRSPLQRRGGAV